MDMEKAMEIVGKNRKFRKLFGKKWILFAKKIFDFYEKIY